MAYASTRLVASLRRTKARTASRRGFSLTELLVVIGIIVLLMGLLLVALRGVMTTSRKTRSQTVVTQFSNACVAFQSAHGRYPGVIPESVLRLHASSGSGPTISSTENALLELMGAYRLLTPADITTPPSQAQADYANFVTANQNEVYSIHFNTGVPGQTYQLAYVRRRLGEGPVINGKPQQPYYTPGSNELVVVQGQLNEPPPPSGSSAGGQLPEPIDAWGQPLLYIRQARSRGPIRPDPAQPGVLPQFELAGASSYLGWPDASPASLAIGEMAQDQIWTTGGNTKGSILTIGDAATRDQTFAAIVGHPAFYRPPPGGNPLSAPPRGQFIVISAGEDGIYFSFGDGPFVPGDEADGVQAVVDKVIEVGPKVVSEFNDIVNFGGG